MPHIFLVYFWYLGNQFNLPSQQAVSSDNSNSCSITWMLFLEISGCFISTLICFRGGVISFQSGYKIIVFKMISDFKMFSDLIVFKMICDFLLESKVSWKLTVRC